MSGKPKILTSFFRYNVVAILATIVDFLIFVFLTEVFELWYVAATFISAVSGGIAAFILNRNWAFMSREGHLSQQAKKYFLVWGSSILLNTAGLYLLVENTNIDAIISKIIVSVIVGLGFNFLMNRFFVFNK
ncbi:MAG: GtrA family protein [Bacteroidales bacterium]|nr:GtrA family protein [Bacteroidales bacterium]